MAKTETENTAEGYGGEMAWCVVLSGWCWVRFSFSSTTIIGAVMQIYSIDQTLLQGAKADGANFNLKEVDFKNL